MATCLVIMPFQKELDSHFDLIKQSCMDQGLEVRRVDTYGYSGNILQAISKALAEADLIIADLSYANPNVMYELAIAQCLGKKVLLFTNDRNTVPFDLLSYRIELIDIESPDQVDRLGQIIRIVLDTSCITGPLGGRVIFGQKLFFRRIAAFAIDSVPLIGIPLVFGYISNATEITKLSELLNLLNAYSWNILLLYIFTFPAYVVICTCAFGRTLGQWILRIKVVTMEGDRVPFWQSMGRAVAYSLVLCTYGIGFLWCLSGPSFRAFHDIASQTIVVRQETAINASQ